MSDEVVLYEVTPPLARIVLNRPNKLNALNGPMVHGISAALERAAADDAVKVLIVTGAGRAFSAGYDIAEEVQQQVESTHHWRELLEQDVAMTMALWSFPKPTIAAVRGYALAGACELAMACDLVVCTEDTRFGEPEIRYGSGPVTLIMPFLLGQKTTNELLLTGDLIDAREALRVGLVNRVVPADRLDAEAERLALRIAPTPLPVLKLTKLALQRAYEAKGLRQAVQWNVELSALLNSARTPEQEEFDAIVRERGLKAALDWRDRRYGERLRGEGAPG